MVFLLKYKKKNEQNKGNDDNQSQDSAETTPSRLKKAGKKFFHTKAREDKSQETPNKGDNKDDFQNKHDDKLFVMN